VCALGYGEEASPKKLSWRKPRLFRETEIAESLRPAPAARLDSRAEARATEADGAVQQATFEGSTSKASQIKQAYALSKVAQSNDDYTSIIALCQRSLRGGATLETERYANKLISWALNRRGEIAAAKGQEQQALDDFEEAVVHDKTRWRALHNRAVSYALLDRYDEAIADLNRTIELNPRFAKAFFNRAELYSQEARFEQAIQDYDKAIELAPDDPASHNSRGYANYSIGRYKHAARDFTEALRLDPKFAAAYANRGMLYADLGYFPRSLHDFRQAVKLDPSLGAAYRGAAWVLATCPDEKYRDTRRALAAAERAIELDGDDDPSYLDALAAAEANAGQFRMAEETIETAMQRATEEMAGPLHGRLELYRQGRPFRTRPRETSVVRRPSTSRR